MCSTSELQPLLVSQSLGSLGWPETPLAHRAIMPPKRFSQKVRDDAPEEPEAASEGDDVDDADDVTHIATCDVCEQDTESWERDLLPEKREKLKWTKVNKSRRTGKIKKAGRQCYHCEVGHKKKRHENTSGFLEENGSK